MEPSLDQLIQSLEQITQQLKDLEYIFGSTAVTYSQRQILLGQSAVKLEANDPSASAED
jgi:hypothetical protein